MESQLSILVVEDNPGDLFLLREHLKASGIALRKLLEAPDLATVRALLQQEQPDLILLDIFLPDSSGIDTFRQVAALAPHTPIAVLSGLSDSETAIEAIKLGAQDYIVKGEYDERLLAKLIRYSIERNSINGRLKTSIERYDLVAKATTDAVWDWDIRTDANWFSENFCTLFGYEAEQVSGSLDAWHQRLHPEDHARVLGSIRAAIAEGRRHWEEEYRFLRADGSYASVFDRGYTLYDAHGKPYRMIGAMQDITRLKGLQDAIISEQLQSQVRVTEATILSQEKERAEIGRELHDNINQLLTTCKLLIETAAGNNDLQAQLLPRSSAYINQAIEEIRKLSKSLVPPTLSDVGLAEALQELVESVGLSGGTAFRVQVAEDSFNALDSQVQLMLYRIVQEGVNNIIKYARATEATIRLERQGASVVLRIADNGAGFNPSERKTGIGLRNIRSRAELLRGTLVVESAPGKGCTLVVTLPVEAASSL